MEKSYKKTLAWKQKFANEIAEFRKKAYETDDLMPKRYCFVLTNLCNLACDFCYQYRTKLKNTLDANDWIKIVKQLPNNSRVTLTGGEPLVLQDFEKVFEVITHSAGNSWAFEDRVPRMHEGEIQVQSSLDIFLKDLGIVLERAKALQLTLPVSESAFNQYEISHKSGMGKEDDSSIYKNYLKTERI